MRPMLECTNKRTVLTSSRIINSETKMIKTSTTIIIRASTLTTTLGRNIRTPKQEHISTTSICAEDWTILSKSKNKKKPRCMLSILSQPTILKESETKFTNDSKLSNLINLAAPFRNSPKSPNLQKLSHLENQPPNSLSLISQEEVQVAPVVLGIFYQVGM